MTRREKNELGRLRKNALAKIRRLRAKGINDLPTIPRIDEINGKGAIKDAKNFLRSFTNIANTRWQYVATDSGYISKRTANSIKREQNRVNRVISKANSRFNKEEYRILSEKFPTAKRTVGRDRREDNARLFTRDVNSFSSEKEAQRYLNRLKSFNSQSVADSDKRLQENYISALQKVHGDESDIVVSIIEQMSPEQFVEKYYTADIQLSYIYTDQDRQDWLSKLESYLSE